MAIHETCLEYFKRRLSEGWKCISLEGHNAVLRSPDGIIRPLDLRNDVLTLRPNAHVQRLCSRFPDSGEDNYEDVDEAAADEDSTYVYNTGDEDVQKCDIYGYPDHTTESGTINSVKVYGRCRRSAGTGYYKAFITLVFGAQHNLTDSYVTYDDTWNTNPITTDPWTWIEIDAFEFGPYLYCLSDGSSLRCTQVYVEVDYTPAAPPAGLENKSANMAAKMIAGKLI